MLTYADRMRDACTGKVGRSLSQLSQGNTNDTVAVVLQLAHAHLTMGGAPYASHARIFTRTHTQTYLNLDVYLYILTPRIHIYVCMSVCMYVCIYIYRVNI
jgi:hypothetical protein